MYTTIVTRYPNFEVGFFAALLWYFEWVRRRLDISRGRLTWEFIPAGGLEGSKYAGKTFLELTLEGIFCFNVGGTSGCDQHGRPENQSGGGCNCSNDILRLEYDFLGRRSYLQHLYNIVRANDISGVRTSPNPRNFREAMNGLTAKYPENPELVLEFLTIGFCGLFDSARLGTEFADPYCEDSVILAVRTYAPKRAEEFRSHFEEGMLFLEEEWKRACADFDREHFTRECKRRDSRALRVVSFKSDSIKAGPLARKRGFDVAIIMGSDGHVQIVSRIILFGQEKKRLDLALIAGALRREEARLQKVSLQGMGDVHTVGCFGDGRLIPWFFPEFRTSVMNGTLSNREMPPTKIGVGRILQIVAEHLWRCTFFVREEDKAGVAAVTPTPAAVTSTTVNG